MSKESVKQKWEKAKELYIKEFEKTPEILKAWIRVGECKYCGAMDDHGIIDIVTKPESVTFNTRLRDIDILVQLQCHPLRIKSEHYGTEKHLIIRDGSELFYFPDKDKDYKELDETILCEVSEMDLMWDVDGTYISQTALDPDYYAILGKVDSDKAEIKRYAKAVEEALSSYGWGFEQADGKIHRHPDKYDIVECQFRTWREENVDE